MLNVELLEKVKEKITEAPDLFEMGNWCGTAQCIAGWVITLSGLRSGHYTGHISGKAAELIGVSRNQALSLFYRSGWEHEEKESFRILGEQAWREPLVKRDEAHAERAVARAEIACRAIDKFITKYSKEAV